MAANNPAEQEQQLSTDQRPSTALPSPQAPRRHEGLGNAAAVRTSSAGNSLSSEISSAACTFEDREGMDQSQWKNVRTLPSWLPPLSWVQKREEDEDDLIALPPLAHRRPPERSIHDAERETTPVTMGPLRGGPSSRWRNFVEVTAYPPKTAGSEKVDPSWLKQQGDLDTPWMANHRDLENQADGVVDDGDVLFVSAKTRRIWYKRIHIMLLNNPMVPLTFRTLIWVLSLLALAFAASVFHLSNKYGFSQKPSTIMAVVVDVIALIYIIYITYDEYSGKPLGLRSPKAKMRLIMLDLFFIILNSANLSLAFDTLFDTRWSCLSDANGEELGSNNLRTVDSICDRQRALASFLFLALAAWIATFTVSVFRLVERVASSSRAGI